MSAAPDPDQDARRRLRALPSVDRLAVEVARAELAARRARVLSGEAGAAGPDSLEELVDAARRRLSPGVPRVLNATGTVLHTNLGRAPLAAPARAAMAAAGGYAALEIDLSSGRRTPRGQRAERLVARLVGAEDALVVNNGAAAVLLAVAALAGPGGRVAVSRGELVEIGGGARIADIVLASGARIAEVGSTNRTTVEDFAAAVADGADVILRVHQSNFTMDGYVRRPGVDAVCHLGVPVIDDIGSGALTRSHPAVGDEPTATDSIRRGASLVAFSADKLLGGPQGGILAGTTAAIAACRGLALARALRVDKLRLAALEATLELHLDPATAAREIPVLEMLGRSEEDLQRSAKRLAKLTGGTIVSLESDVGGGSLPGRRTRHPAVALDAGPAGPEALAAALRRGDPPLLTRIRDGQLLLAVRTLGEDEVDVAAACLRAARRSPSDLATSGP